MRTLTAVQTDVAGNVDPASGVAIIGTSGADTLTATVGNDLLIGGAGADTFVFNSVFGHDIIGDFAASGTGHDIIDFHGSRCLRATLTY